MSNDLLDTAETARILGVKPASLYSYVARGLLTAHRAPGDRRSWFAPAEVEAMRLRGRVPRRPGTEVRVVSAITTIAVDGLRYRGLDPLQLACSTPFEAVCRLLWDQELPAATPTFTASAEQVALAAAVTVPLPAGAAPIDRIRVVVPAVALLDALRFDRRPAAPALVGPGLISTMVAAIDPAVPATGRIAERLARALGARDPATAGPVVDAALVLIADHELAASTMAARLAASFAADPYAAVTAGLAALSGARHGAASLEVEALLEEIATDGAAAAIGARLRRDENLPGLGHPLYPDGDPRARALLALLPNAPPDVAAILDAVRVRGLPAPNVDLALGSLARALGMRRGTGETIFAVGRTAGWLAHIAEEYGEPSALRFRATPPDVR
jgi:citrate synthase